MAAHDRDEADAQAAWHRHYEETARRRNELVGGRRTSALQKRRVRRLRLVLAALAIALVAGALTVALAP